MNKLYEKVIQESEKFLREKRAVTITEFIKIISEDNFKGQVEERKFKIEQTPLTQMYVELNGEYVYSTTIG